MFGRSVIESADVPPLKDGDLRFMSWAERDAKKRAEEIDALNREVASLKARGRKIRILTGRVPPAITERLGKLQERISSLSDPVLYGDGQTP